jgi:hydrogenase maturation factor HypF (carbamoyltransferase family)
MQRITTAVLKDESELKNAALNSEEIDVYNIDDLLKILYMFLEDHINKNQYNFKKTDVQQAIDLVDMIRKLIETHQKKEQQQINTMIILTVYKGMLDIIGKYVDSQVLEKIKNDISLMSLPKEIQDVEFKETQL